jgi:hypothetical protein
MSLVIGRFDDLILFASRDYAYASLVLLILVTLGLLLWERGSTGLTTGGQRRTQTPPR